MLAVGDKAPSFSLYNHHGDSVQLVDLAGRWAVLFFYQKDDSPSCTLEACEFSTVLPDLDSMNAVVWGCSPDSVESHRRFMAKHDLDVGLLSDPDHTTMAKYGAWGESKLYGRTRVGVIRSTVLINPAGIIAYRWRRATFRGHADKVRARLADMLRST